MMYMKHGTKTSTDAPLKKQNIRLLWSDKETVTVLKINTWNNHKYIFIFSYILYIFYSVFEVCLSPCCALFFCKGLMTPN